MSNGDQTVKYTLDITQKPSVVLTYYDSDGITVLGKSRREKGKTIEHFDFGADDVTVEEGFKMRGWYHEPEGGLKYTLEEKVVEDISLYAMTTIIEEVSNSAIYNFDLTDIYFDPDNHEAFNPKGKGFYWYDDIHGWAFKNDNQIDLLVGPRATISLKLCQENYANDSIIVISQAGDTLSILSPKVEEDGDLVNYLYEGDVAAENMGYICGPMPVAPGIAQLDDDFRALIMLDAESLRKGQVIKSFDDRPDVQALYDAAWSRIKATDDR